jgi:hypothetical protein
MGDQGKWWWGMFRGTRREVKVVHDGAIGGDCLGAVCEAGGASRCTEDLGTRNDMLYSMAFYRQKSTHGRLRE